MGVGFPTTLDELIDLLVGWRRSLLFIFILLPSNQSVSVHTCSRKIQCPPKRNKQLKIKSHFRDLSMASSIQSTLERLLDRTNQLKKRLGDNNIKPTEQQWDALLSLSTRLTESVTELQQDLESVKTKRRTDAWNESDDLRMRARHIQNELFSSSSSSSPSSSSPPRAKGKFQSLVIFRRNITIIFEGPKASLFDSTKTNIWKELTKKRCQVLKTALSPDGVVLWALSYSPHLWAGGAMAQDVFDCLVEDIEPDAITSWPPVIVDTLRKLREDEPSLKSTEYGQFLHAIGNPRSCPPQEGSKRGTKRRRDDQYQQQQQEEEQEQQSEAPYSNGHADTNIHMNINNQRPTTTDDLSSKQHEAPVGFTLNTASPKFFPFSQLRRDEIDSIPEPLRSGILGSRQWSDETKTGKRPSTHCMSLFLPAEFGADAYLRVCISYSEGFKLMQYYGFGDDTHETYLR
jgi:hypothetical protein